MPRKLPPKTPSRPPLKLPPTPPDARVKRSKDAVLAETFKLLAENGLGGVSVDEVSRRSGVAKTTIYRHWPTRTALLLEACSSLGSPPEIPRTGSLRGDLLALLSYMAKRLQSNRWSSVLPSIVDAAERDREVAGLHARIHAGFMAPLLAVLERAQRHGELPRAARPSEIVAQLVGPLFYRRWFSREEIDERFVKGVVDGVLRGTQSGRG